jgi:UDP-N-acetylmuramyl pentapeptide phosphotransferase/UDP-N-acetylglucosamine-1-phosphate transferase
MTWVDDVIFGLWAAGLAVAFAAGSRRGWFPVPTATNHRGSRVPLSLGYALALGYGFPSAAVGFGWFSSDVGDRLTSRAWLWFVLAMALVFVAGLLDDRLGAPVHGVRAHFGALAHGRVTSGIVKVVAALVAATIVVVSTGTRGWTAVMAILLVAGTTNLVNVLDVAPGRALKFSLAVGALLLLIRSSGLGWATVGQSAVLLPFDVRERGMLGDAGANLLGFVLGYVAFEALSTTWMAVALVGVLILNALAETVTLTRIIRATPPLRWFDDLWQIPAADPTTN